MVAAFSWTWMMAEMTDRKRTKSEERAYVELIGELHELDTWHRQNELKLRTIPKGWQALEEEAPCTPGRTKITASFDADVVKWFRALGDGYQSRMNAVLRIYMLSVLSKEIEQKGDRDWKGDPL
jgi:uncharacterized protein (DUF4415 family)